MLFLTDSSAVEDFWEGFLEWKLLSTHAQRTQICQCDKLDVGLNVKATCVINLRSRFQTRGLTAEIAVARVIQQPWKQSSLDVIWTDYWEEQPQRQLSLYSPYGFLTNDGFKVVYIPEKVFISQHRHETEMDGILGVRCNLVWILWLGEAETPNGGLSWITVPPILQALGGCRLIQTEGHMWLTEMECSHFTCFSPVSVYKPWGKLTHFEALLRL